MATDQQNKQRVLRAIQEQREREAPRLQEERDRLERQGRRATPQEMQDGFDRDFPEIAERREKGPDRPLAEEFSIDNLFELVRAKERQEKTEKVNDALFKALTGQDRVDSPGGPIPLLMDKAQEIIADSDVQKALIEGGAVLATEMITSKFKIPLKVAQKIVEVVAPMLTSAGVEVGFQKTGLSEESTSRIVGASAAPLVGNLGMSVVKKGLGALVKRLPGAAAAQNEIAVNTVKTLEDQVMPLASATALFNQAKQFGAGKLSIGMKNTAQEILDIARNVGTLSSGGQREVRKAARYAQGLFEKIQEQGGTLPYDDLVNERIVISNLIAKTGGKAGDDPVVRPIYKRLYRGIMNDLEVAAQSKTVQGRASAKMLLALKADRKEKAAADLADMMQKGFGNVRKDVPIQEFNAGKVIKNIQNIMKRAKSKKAKASDKLFVESFERGELEDVLNTLHSLRGIPRMGPDLGEQAGFLKLGLRSSVIFGGTFGASGNAQLAGALVAGAESLRWVIAKALTSRPGRSLLRKLLESNRGIMNSKTGAILFAGLAGANPEETAQAGEAIQGAIRSAQEFGGPLMNQLTQGRRVTR